MSRSVIILLFACLAAVSNAAFLGTMAYSGACPTNLNNFAFANGIISGSLSLVSQCTTVGTQSFKYENTAANGFNTTQNYYTSTDCSGTPVNKTGIASCLSTNGVAIVANALVDTVPTTVTGLTSNFAILYTFANGNTNCNQNNVASAQFQRLGLGQNACVQSVFANSTTSPAYVNLNGITCASGSLSATQYNNAACTTGASSLSASTTCTGNKQAFCNIAASNSTTTGPSSTSGAASVVIASFAVVFAMFAALF